MKMLRIVAVVVLIFGLGIILYGGYGYTQRSRQLSIGSIEMSISNRKEVTGPIVIGIIAMISGVVMLVIGRKKQ